MKNHLKPIFATLLLVLMFVACDSFANTWQPKTQVFPHGGTGVNPHERMSPSNLATATTIANGHGYFNYNVEQSSSTTCIAGTVWTFFTYSVNFRPNDPVSFGYVQFWRQDC